MIPQRHRPPPAGTIPADQRDARHPPRLLPDGGHQGRREIGTDRHHAASCSIRDPREQSLAAEFGDPQAEFVILGQAGRIERIAPARLGDPSQHGRGQGAAGARQRHARPDPGADDQLLDVAFGEPFVTATMEGARQRPAVLRRIGST